MFRLTYRYHQADRENKNNNIMFTSAGEVLDLEPLQIYCYTTHTYLDTVGTVYRFVIYM